MPQLHTAHHTPEALARVAMLIEDAIRVAGPARPDKLRAYICRPAGMVDAAIGQCVRAGELRVMSGGYISIVRTSDAQPTPMASPPVAATSSGIYHAIVAAGPAGATATEIRHALGARGTTIWACADALRGAGLIRCVGANPARFVAVADLDDDERAAVRALKSQSRRWLLEVAREPQRATTEGAQEMARRLRARGLIQSSPAGWVLSELGRIVLPVVAAAEEAAR